MKLLQNCMKASRFLTKGNYNKIIKYTAVRNASNEHIIKLIAIKESKRFMVDCFEAVKVPKKNANLMADLLIEADYRGHFSHGMNRLEMYINDLLKNSTNGSAEPKILKETAATAWIDGCNGLGAVVGSYCMDLAIQKAKNCGVSFVCAKRSNHFGIAGWYTLRAMKENLIGMAMTNTSPLMAPTRGKSASLGTNPISLGAQGNLDSFWLDMATTAVAVGKIEMQKRKNEMIPNGWAQGPDGKETNNADLAFETGCLLPLGGPEITGGYKGYGLGAVVDILSGVLSGGNFSTSVRKWTHSGSDEEANLGHCFLALDPEVFVPDFKNRLTDFLCSLRNTLPTDPSKTVLVAGDKEKEHMRKVDKMGGIQYLPNQLETCMDLAKRLAIKPMSFV